MSAIGCSKFMAVLLLNPLPPCQFLCHLNLWGVWFLFKAFQQSYSSIVMSWSDSSSMVTVQEFNVTHYAYFLHIILLFTCRPILKPSMIKHFPFVFFPSFFQCWILSCNYRHACILISTSSSWFVVPKRKDFFMWSFWVFWHNAVSTTHRYAYLYYSSSPFYGVIFCWGSFCWCLNRYVIITLFWFCQQLRNTIWFAYDNEQASF